MEQELFKPFPLAPLVQVGNLGTIVRPNGKVAKQTPMNIGYLNVGIMVNGKSYMNQPLLPTYN